MRRYLLLAVFGTLIVAPSVLAADGDTDKSTTAPAPLVLPTGAAMVAADAANGTEVTPSLAYRPDHRGMDARRPILFALHGATGIVQAFDGMTTLKVLRAGGIEANPLMSGVVTNERGLMAAKIGAAAATIIGTETLWHHNHRTAALIVSMVANSAMAAVANHNSQVLQRFEASSK
jgi:hypothetical protein